LGAIVKAAAHAKQTVAYLRRLAAPDVAKEAA